MGTLGGGRCTWNVPVLPSRGPFRGTSLSQNPRENCIDTNAESHADRRLRETCGAASEHLSNMSTGIIGGAPGGPGGITFSATVGPTWMQTEWSKVRRAELPSILTPTPCPCCSPPHHDAWSVPDGLARPRRVLSFTPWPTSRHVLSSGRALPHSLRSPRTPLLSHSVRYRLPWRERRRDQERGHPGG